MLIMIKLGVYMYVWRHLCHFLHAMVALIDLEYYSGLLYHNKKNCYSSLKEGKIDKRPLYLLLASLFMDYVDRFASPALAKRLYTLGKCWASVLSQRTCSIRHTCDAGRTSCYLSSITLDK